MGNLFCKTDDNGNNATAGNSDPDFHHGSSTWLSEDNHETETWNKVTNKKLNKLTNKKQSEASESELSSNARAPEKHIAADSIKPHPDLYQTRIQTKTKNSKQSIQNLKKTNKNKKNIKNKHKNQKNHSNNSKNNKMKNSPDLMTMKNMTLFNQKLERLCFLIDIVIQQQRFFNKKLNYKDEEA